VSAVVALPPRAPATPPPARLKSLIISDFPSLFEEFRAKRFKRLWRDSRDGFTAQKCHLRCDGRTNTLTLISDTDGNIFGGFTPVEWENDCSEKEDDSLWSFLFTLRNPDGVPLRKFMLKAEKKQYTIYYNSAYCAVFGWSDIYVYDNCNANRENVTHIGTRY
jgi:hypothetical protein